MKSQYPDNGSPSISTYSLCHVKTLDSMIEILLAAVDQAPRGLALKIKAQKLEAGAATEIFEKSPC